MTCKTHGDTCPTPYSCGQELPVTMLDDPMPTLFEMFDNAVNWIRQHFIGIVAVVAMVSFSAGVYVKFFI